MSFLHCSLLAEIRDCGESIESPVPTEPFIESPIPSESFTKSTSTISASVIAAIIMSFLVMIAMAGVIVLILFYCRKTKQLKEYYNPSE